MFPLRLDETTRRVPRCNDSDGSLVLSKFVSMGSRHGIIASDQHTVRSLLTESPEERWIC